MLIAFGEKINIPEYNDVYEKINEMRKKSNPSELVESINQGITLTQIVLTTIANVSGDMAESGKYHIYRGVLNPMHGVGLIKIYNSAIDELVSRGIIDKSSGEAEIKGLLNNIKNVG